MSQKSNKEKLTDWLLGRNGNNVSSFDFWSSVFRFNRMQKDFKKKLEEYNKKHNIP
jgi:hypothetical protein